MTIDKELKRGDKFDIISFDIFDTLIERSVMKPSTVFYQIGLEVLKERGKAKLFRERRISAEVDARRESESGEVNLNDIYRKLFVYYGITAGILKEHEINAEIEGCKARVKWRSLFYAYLHNNKKVLLISDMYLPSSVIVDMLRKCGIDGYCSLFVSNEYGCNKVSGFLFSLARQNVGCVNGTHLHYGDSIMADYIGAKKGGAKPRMLLKNHWLYKLIIKNIDVTC